MVARKCVTRSGSLSETPVWKRKRSRPAVWLYKHNRLWMNQRSSPVCWLIHNLCLSIASLQSIKEINGPAGLLSQSIQEISPYPRAHLEPVKTLLSGSACARRSDSEENKSPPYSAQNSVHKWLVINKPQRAELIYSAPCFHAQRKLSSPHRQAP